MVTTVVQVLPSMNHCDALFMERFICKQKNHNKAQNETAENVTGHRPWFTSAHRVWKWCWVMQCVSCEKTVLVVRRQHGSNVLNAGGVTWRAIQDQCCQLTSEVIPWEKIKYVPQTLWRYKSAELSTKKIYAYINLGSTVILKTINETRLDLWFLVSGPWTRPVTNSHTHTHTHTYIGV
jgi:hypothetical protein